MTEQRPDLRLVHSSDETQAGELETVVYDAELVDEPEPSKELAVRRPGLLVRVQPPDKTVHVAREVLAHAVTIGQGGHSWFVRAWSGLTLGVYRRQVRAAEKMGDRVALAEWTDRLQAARDRRHARLLELPRLMWGLAKVALGILLALAVLVPFVAALVWVTGGDGREVFWWVGGVLRWLFGAVAFLWPLLVAGTPVALLVAAWREGRRQGRTPGWLSTAGDADVNVEIDETTIASALKALRIPQIRDYLKSGLPLQFLVTARRDGRGTYAELRLPAGVTAETISRRRANLATGLYRAAKEVWPSTGAEAGVLKLWVADKGALAEGAGPYPLLTEGIVDVFKGVPFGKTLRGDPIVAPVIGRNTIVGGMPEQGKSSAARVIMTGAALDHTAELRIYVPDANYDFEVFRRRCSRYVMGAEDEKIRRIRDDLQELDEEVQIRGDLLVQYQEPEVTRKLADAGVGLHPLVALLEEAHVAFQHKIYGEEIQELAISIVKLGRKRGIHLIVSTQAPTKDSMPRDVTRNCSNGIAFAVGDHVANDALLGAGAYRAGHRATELIPGVDRGVAVVKGFTGQRSEMVQAYFLSVSKGHDQVTPIIGRALAEMSRRGLPLPGSSRPAQRTSARDLLADLSEVMGEERARMADLPALLRQLAPDHAPYKRLTGTRLAELLAEEGVRVTNTNNVKRLDPEDLHRALAERDAGE